jgi:hypothetical protein
MAIQIIKVDAPSTTIPVHRAGNLDLFVLEMRFPLRYILDARDRKAEVLP